MKRSVETSTYILACSAVFAICVIVARAVGAIPLGLTWILLGLLILSSLLAGFERARARRAVTPTPRVAFDSSMPWALFALIGGVLGILVMIVAAASASLTAALAVVAAGVAVAVAIAAVSGFREGRRRAHRRTLPPG